MSHSPINLIDPVMTVEPEVLLTEIEQADRAPYEALPGGGRSTRLPGNVGRGRALEILLGGEDFALEQGFQQRSDVELNLGAYVGKVVTSRQPAD